MRPMPELRVEEMAVSELREYERNAKIHTQAQIDQISNSISEFGFDNPVLAWHNADGDDEIVAGHGRVAAARKLGIETVPVIFLDHLEDEQRRALTHVLNQTTLSSGFDLEVLDLEMEELEFDWDEFGFGSGASFDAIEDLMTEEFWANGVGGGDTFNITFTFPIGAKEEVQGYVKAIGKEEIVAHIIEEAEKWQ